MKSHYRPDLILHKKFYYRLIGLGLIVGIVAGVVASLYRLAIAYSQEFSQSVYAWAKTPWQILCIFLGLALLGLIVGWLIKGEPLIKGSGIPQAEGTILGFFQMRWLKILIKKFIGGVLGILGGLSLGREGPSILLGAMTGQGISNAFHRDTTEQKYLITCGACAGLAAAFNAPLAGVMLALEEIHRSFSPKVLLSALASALTACLISRLFFGSAPTFSLPSLSELPAAHYWLLLPLGILLGLFGAGYNKCVLFTQNLYQKIHLPLPVKMIIPFFIAGIFGLCLPQVLGGGHNIVDGLIIGQYALPFLFLLLVGKFVLSMTSFGSGAPGGIFFPLLVLGALAGVIFGQAAVSWAGLESDYVLHFMLFGMLGMFTAIVRAPLTGILLIVEMSASFDQLICLAIVAFLSYITADLCHSKPIYESLLERAVNQGNADSPAQTAAVSLEFTVCLGSPADGRQIKQIIWPADCLVIAVMRNSQQITPKGNTRLQVGDLLTLLCPAQCEAQVRQYLSQEFSDH